MEFIPPWRDRNDSITSSALSQMGQQRILRSSALESEDRVAASNEPEDEPTRITGVNKGSIGGGDGDSQKLKSSVSLLREEAEEDFTAFIGKKPPRKPNKKPRTVQKQMNIVASGGSNTGSYESPEAAET